MGICLTWGRAARSWTGERGLLLGDAPPDMRMDAAQELTAEQVVTKWSDFAT
jgi:16S rRNA C1402 N4-methylase RsmH